MMAAFAGVASPILSRFFPDFPQRLTPGAIRLLRMRRHADTRKAQVELGYRPSNIESAVEEAYAFFCARGAIQNPAARQPTPGAAGRAPSESRAA
jgi:nucleoside-diphosphate-sugar epimerase